MIRFALVGDACHTFRGNHMIEGRVFYKHTYLVFILFLIENFVGSSSDAALGMHCLPTSLLQVAGKNDYSYTTTILKITP